MRSLFFLFLLFSISCNEETIKHTGKFNQMIQVSAFINGLYYCNCLDCSFNYYLINLKVINLSDSTIRFWTYSSGITDNFILSDSTYEIVHNIYDANFPILNELKPEQSLVVPFTIKHSDTADPSFWPAFRLGFVLIYENQHHVGLNFWEIFDDVRKSDNQVFWSNELNLFTDIKKPYEIY